MFSNGEEMITNFYGMKLEPNPKIQKQYDKKRQAAIEYLGDKYCLAKSVERKDG